MCRAAGDAMRHKHMHDRRAKPRYDVQWPLRVAHRTDGCLYGTVANFSPSGVLFVAPGLLEPDEMVEAEIAVAPLFTIRCALRVVRACAILTGDWAYGAEFVQLG